MAQQRIGNRIGVAARNASSGAQRSNMNGSTSVSGELEDTDMVSITALRSRLAAIDAGYYTATRLNVMTYNDMIYAVRIADAPGSI